MATEYEIREAHRDAIRQTYEADRWPKTSDRILYDVAPQFGIDSREVYRDENMRFRYIVYLSLRDLVGEGILEVRDPWGHASPNQAVSSRYALL